MSLIDNLIEDGWLKTPRIIEAFQKIKRVDFMPENVKHLSELDQPVPIGYGQTISQPLVVAFMIEQLEPEPGDKILDIGSGSGWTTALLAHIVGDKGNVISIEVVPELSKFGEENISKYNFVKKGIVEIVCADGSKGYKKQAPYDKILVSAAVQQEKVPEPWREQLKNDGRIVTPVLSSIWLLVKNPPAGGKTIFKETEFPGFAFVPLIEK